MGSSIVSLALLLSVGASGQASHVCNNECQHSRQSAIGRFFQGEGRILAPGPGYGWGFRNGNPDGYGWFDPGTALPLGANRTPEYYFPRYNALPPPQLILPGYYNSYVTRGQRYLPFAGCGGEHPAGGPPVGSAYTPTHPYLDTLGNGPSVAVPAFSGRIEAPPVNSGGTGLTP
ncbi:MAG: hypothetical protein NVSMB9_29890 [Isosphaeraceae bacterium]